MDKVKIKQDCETLLGLAPNNPFNYNDIWEFLTKLNPEFYEENFTLGHESPWNDVEEVLKENSKGPNPTFVRSGNFNSDYTLNRVS